MYKLIHNPHQQESREILQQLLNDPEISPQLEVIDFMEARRKWRFRATPTLWKVEENKITMELDEKFTVEDIGKAEKLSKDIEPSEEEKQRLEKLDERTTILSCLAKLLQEGDPDKTKLQEIIKKAELSAQSFF